MYSRLSVRDAWGHPKKFRSASEAGLTFQAPSSGLVFDAPLDSLSTATGQTLTNNGVAFTADSTLGRAAAVFDGSGYLTSTYANLPQANAPATFSCWFKPASAKGHMLISYGTNRGSSYPNSLFQFVANLTDNTAGLGNHMPGTPVFKSYTFTLNSWVHLAATHTAAGATEIFAGGTSLGTGTIDLSNMNLIDECSIGRYYGALDTSSYTVGSIAAMRIYNRVLATSEISMLAREFGI